MQESNAVFFESARKQFSRLFDDAKKKNELHFVFSLAPEFRPYAINTAIDAQRAIDDYVIFLNENGKGRIQARVALALYSHIAEASGLWEVPKNLLNIIAGESYNLMPFRELVKKYGSREGQILPTVNKVMRSLINFSDELGYSDLAKVFKDAFDYELRNGYAHADYAILEEGICIGSRYNNEKIVSWVEFNKHLNRALNFYKIFSSILAENSSYYSQPTVIKGFLNDREPESTWVVHCKKDGVFEIKSEGGELDNSKQLVHPDTRNGARCGVTTPPCQYPLGRLWI